MDKEQLLKAMEEKRKEMEEIEKALKALEIETVEKTEVDQSELLREIKGFPRYYINQKGEVFHETGIGIKILEKNSLELFDSKNNKVLVKIDDLLKENF